MFPILKYVKLEPIKITRMNINPNINIERYLPNTIWILDNGEE